MLDRVGISIQLKPRKWALKSGLTGYLLITGAYGVEVTGCFGSCYILGCSFLEPDRHTSGFMPLPRGTFFHSKRMRYSGTPISSGSPLRNRSDIV